jgi:hypothetical protein
MTNAFFTLLMDLNSPSMRTCRPGYIKVESKVINPESLCSGATRIYSFGLSRITSLGLGK